MRKDWLDKRLEQKLEGFEMPLDLESAWDNLEQIRKKKKKKVFIPWIGTFLILGLFSFLIYPHLEPNESQSKVIKARIDSIESSTKTERYVETTTIGNTMEHSRENFQFQDNSTSIPKATSTFASESYSNKKSFKEHKVYVEDSYIIGPSSITSDEIDLDEIVASTTDTNSMQKKISKSPFSEILKKSELNVIPIFPLTQISVVESISEMKVPEQPQPQPEISVKTNQFGFVGMYGITKVKRTNINLDEIAFKQLEESEKPIDVIGAGITFTHILKNNIYLNTGLLYHQWSDRLNIQKSSTISELRENIPVEIRSYNNGLIDTLYGNVMVQNEQIGTFDIWNKNTLIGVPLGVGYHWKIKDRMSIKIGAGFLTSYLLNSESDLLNTNNNELSRIDSEEFNSFLFQFNGNLSAIYKLNNTWNLSLGIQTLQDLNDRKKSNASYSAKYKSYNLNLGLSKNF